MSKLRRSKNVSVSLGIAAGLVLLARPAWASQTYTDALNDITGPEAAAPFSTNPPGYVDLASVTITSTTTNNIIFAINVNPSADLTQTNQEFANYEIGIQIPGQGANGSPLVFDPFGDFIGISTGMNYWIGAFPGGAGGAAVYSSDSAGDYTQVGATHPVTVAPNTLTVTVPLADVGLTNGSSFYFDVWTTFGNPGGQGAYDALDNATYASGPYNAAAPPVPYPGGANAPDGNPTVEVAYDSATAVGSTFGQASTLYTVVEQAPPTPTWKSAASGDWNSSTNWLNAIPNGIGQEADFQGALGTNGTVFTNTAETVGTMNFNNTSSYVITGTGSLTLQQGSGAAQVIVQAGRQVLDLPVTLASSANFAVSPGASLVIGNPLTIGSGFSVTQTGGGSVIYESNLTLQSGASISFGNSTHAHNLTLAGGATATIASGSHADVEVDSLTLAAGANVNLTNNGLTINYAAPAADPIATIVPLLSAGYNSGHWTGLGITSSTAAASPTKFALGYLDGNVVTDAQAHTVGANQIAIKYTLAGDAFLEGSVGFDDLVAVAQNFGKTGKDWASGNFNYDPTGSVGFPDLVLVAQNFGATTAIVSGDSGSTGLSPLWEGGTAAVPEPASASLAAAAGAGLLARRRKRTWLGRAALMGMLGLGAAMLPAAAHGQVTYTDPLGDNSGPTYVDLAGVVVTNDSTNIYFQINVNPAANLTSSSQNFGNYEVGMQTGPGGSTAITNPFGNSIGISTGMNYFIGGFAGGTGGANVYGWNGTNFQRVTTGTITGVDAANSLTLTIPLIDVGLRYGGTFKFDIWSTFGSPQSAYDALDNPNNATAPGMPFASGGNPPTPYDSATAVGSTFNTTTYTIPPTATANTWNITASGNWNVGNNWYLGTPNGVGAEADLLDAITGATTVFNDQPITLGTLKLNNANEYLIGGAGSLTMQTASGSAQIVVPQGTQEIDQPLTFASNTTLNVTSGATLIIANPVTVNAGKAVTTTGGGTVTYESTVTLGAGASLNFAGGGGIQTATLFGLGSGANVNLNTSSLSVNYGVGNPSPLAQVVAELHSGYNGGAWTGSGISSSSAAAGGGKFVLAYADGSADSGTAAKAGQVLVKYTLAGDTNLDGSVDFADLAAVAQNFGKKGEDWAGGNFSYDPSVAVGFADLVAVAQEFGQSLGSSGSAGGGLSPAWQGGTAAVPEPATIGVLAVMSAGLLVRRRK